MKTLSERLGMPLLLSVLAAATVACGGTAQFPEGSPIRITVAPPPPPEPEPEPPPKPKRVTVTEDKIVISEKIHFEVNKATILPDSHSLLDEIVQVMKENPQIKKVSIQGHTDSDGSDGYNKKLSQQRAKAVMTYLTSHGIKAERLESKGFGEEEPLASNDTAEGKERNRRVEFLILKQDTVKKTMLVDPETGKPVEEEAK